MEEQDVAHDEVPSQKSNRCPLGSLVSPYEVYISENLLKDEYEQVEEQDVAYDEVPSQQSNACRCGPLFLSMKCL